MKSPYAKIPLAPKLFSIALLILIPASTSALELVRGTPASLSGSLGDVQVNYFADVVQISTYLDATGVVTPPEPIPARRIQYDVLNNNGNDSIVEFRVDYDPGVVVIGAADPQGFYDSAGNLQTYWAGLFPWVEFFDRGFGIYDYDISEWEIEYQAGYVIWRQRGNGFFPDTATGATNFGLNPTFSLLFAPDTTLDLRPASVSGFELTSASGTVLSGIAPPEIEVDFFPNSTALVGIQMPDGSRETLRLSGPTEVNVFLGQLADTDDDGLEQVPTEIVALSLTGVSPTLGDIRLQLRDQDLSPFRRSIGEIEENVNNAPGMLDVPPFTNAGTADSFFDVFFEVDVGGLVMHTEDPSRMESTISRKPPGPGTAYDKPPGYVELYTENNEPTGILIVQASHVPQPGDIEVDIFPDSFAVIDLETPVGFETILLSGPTIVEVEIANPADPDGNTREQVPTEIVSMDLVGNSPVFGPIVMRLRDGGPPSVGQIEETENTQPGRLDLPPFAPDGTADSFFDVFFEVEVAGEVLFNLEPKRLRALINYKPPRWGQMYESPERIELYDSAGNPTGIVIGAGRHAPDPIEVDFFPDTLAVFELITPTGLSEIIRLRGPTTVEVDLAAILDTDGDTREQVPTEMVQLRLSGDSLLGPVEVNLRDVAKSPFRRTLGEIEELNNNTPGILDLPPFTEAGYADSFFDVFFEIQVAGLVWHNEVPKRLITRINHKPPGPVDAYESPEPIELFDELNQPTGFIIGASRHVPVPDPDGDGQLYGDDNCILEANPDQRDTDQDGFGNICDPDINQPENDCITNFLDLGMISTAFFSNPSLPNWNPDADFNGDNIINFPDLQIMKSLFFRPPGPSSVANLCRPDLFVRLVNPPTTVSCPGGQGTCVHDVDLQISELNNVAVNEPFDVSVVTDSGLGAVITIPSIGAGAVLPLTLTLGPGDNCYNPDCQVSAEVDSGTIITESDESNNTATRLDMG